MPYEQIPPDKSSTYLEPLQYCYNTIDYIVHAVLNILVTIL